MRASTANAMASPISIEVADTSVPVVAAPDAGSFEWVSFARMVLATSIAGAVGWYLIGRGALWAWSMLRPLIW